MSRRDFDRHMGEPPRWFVIVVALIFALVVGLILEVLL